MDVICAQCGEPLPYDQQDVAKPGDASAGEQAALRSEQLFGRAQKKP